MSDKNAINSRAAKDKAIIPMKQQMMSLAFMMSGGGEVWETGQTWRTKTGDVCGESL
jgi:hypothetical protein